MTRFSLTALAASLAIATPVLADDHAIDPSNLILASDLQGADIYSDFADEPWTAKAADMTFEAKWNSIGHVENVVLDGDGEVQGFVADVGGFLGIGDKHVMLEMDKVRIVQMPDGNGEYSMAVRETEDSLKDMPAVEKGFLE